MGGVFGSHERPGERCAAEKMSLKTPESAELPRTCGVVARWFTHSSPATSSSDGYPLNTALTLKSHHHLPHTLFFPACLPTFVLVCLPFHSFFRAFKNYSAVRSICPHFILTAAVLALQLELSPSSSPNMDHSRHILSSSQDQLFQQATRASQCLSACAPEKSAFADHRVRL